MKDSLFLRRKLRRSPKQQYSVITSVGPADRETSLVMMIFQDAWLTTVSATIKQSSCQQALKFPVPLHSLNDYTTWLPHLQQCRLPAGWQCSCGFPSNWGLSALTSVPLSLWSERSLWGEKKCWNTIRIRSAGSKRISIWNMITYHLKKQLLLTAN